MTASDDRWGLPRDVNSTVDMADDVQRCIYHLGADGGFEKEAHLIPESSSNERCVLPPGRECDRCNGEGWIAAEVVGAEDSLEQARRRAR